MSCFWPSVESSSPSSFAGATCTVCGRQIEILMEGFHVHRVLGSNSDPQPCYCCVRYSDVNFVLDKCLKPLKRSSNAMSMVMCTAKDLVSRKVWKMVNCWYIC